MALNEVHQEEAEAVKGGLAEGLGGLRTSSDFECT